MCKTFISFQYFRIKIFDTWGFSLNLQTFKNDLTNYSSLSRFWNCLSFIG